MVNNKKYNSYNERLLDPRWQKKRLEILSRDEFTCKRCGDNTNTLHVHHKIYFNNNDPWDYENKHLITLCANCHEIETFCGKTMAYDFLRFFQEAGFLNSDIGCIIGDGIDIKSDYPPEFMACVMSFFLTDHNAQKAIVDLFFESVGNKQGKNGLDINKTCQE